VLFRSRWAAVIPKGNRKVNDIAEGIEIDVTIEDLMQSLSKKGRTILTSKLGIKHQDNTAEGSVLTPANTKFIISCDENNNFVPCVTYNTTQYISYLNTYTIDETTYSDVYVFNIVENIIAGSYKDDYTYYVSKQTGFIRCLRQCEYENYDNFDLVLIDKNVLQ
jgi:hypothetical protein